MELTLRSFFCLLWSLGTIPKGSLSMCGSFWNLHVAMASVPIFGHCHIALLVCSVLWPLCHKGLGRAGRSTSGKRFVETHPTTPLKQNGDGDILIKNVKVNKRVCLEQHCLFVETVCWRDWQRLSCHMFVARVNLGWRVKRSNMTTKVCVNLPRYNSRVRKICRVQIFPLFYKDCALTSWPHSSCIKQTRETWVYTYI